MTRAVAVLRPKPISALVRALDPDRDDADLLDDQSLLLTTSAAFGAADVLRSVLAGYGPELVESHTDARGVLCFPERFYPTARSYEGVLAAVEAVGVWVPASALDEGERAELARRKRSSLRAHERTLAGRTVLAPFRETWVSPSSTQEPMERLQAMFERPHTVAALARMTMADVLLIRARRSPPRRPLLRGKVHVLQHRVLPDGTNLLVVQIRGARKHEVVAHVLATSTRARPWLDEHDDARGVPYLLSRDLERLGRVHAYEEALDLADEVTFVRPQRREQQVEEKKRRLRRALALDE